MKGEFAWDHAVMDIPDTGLSIDRTAVSGELERIAAAFDLIACPSLKVQYTIRPIGNGRYRLSGMLQAEVEQTCVVTLEPINSKIEEAFDVVFWPEEQIPAPANGELDLSYDFDPEPIVGGQIEVGRIVFEWLAGGIDPYPRLPGAKLDRQSAPGDGAGGFNSPFAVLAKIKSEH
jgi:hypothetical protein